MKKIVAFDVYGTLIDTHGVVVLLETMIGKQAQMFSEYWRQKQLEYSFRRGLMRDYKNFSVCTSQALDYTCDVLDINLSEPQKRSLLSAYQTLPAFSDVEKGLSQLQDNYQLVAFSNGSKEAVEGLLVAAGIRHFFVDIVSTDEIQSFKPNPDVYQHLLNRMSADACNTWFISSNPFDVIGAMAMKINTAWVARTDKAVFDPWDVAPTVTVNNLAVLADKMLSENN